MAGTMLTTASPSAPINMVAILFLADGGERVSGGFDGVVDVFDDVKNFMEDIVSKGSC